VFCILIFEFLSLFSISIPVLSKVEGFGFDIRLSSVFCHLSSVILSDLSRRSFTKTEAKNLTSLRGALRRGNLSLCHSVLFCGELAVIRGNTVPKDLDDLSCGLRLLPVLSPSMGHPAKRGLLLLAQLARKCRISDDLETETEA